MKIHKYDTGFIKHTYAYSTHNIYPLGCKQTGYFGDDCSLACPRNCQERRSHIHTGYCLGCLPGYKEESCNKSKIILL